jgi:hypothetical protein
MRATRPARTPSLGATPIMPRRPLTFDAAFVQSLTGGRPFLRRSGAPALSLIEYGSISAHTFTSAGGSGPKIGDWQVCTTDEFREYSCSSHGFS